MNALIEPAHSLDGKPAELAAPSGKAHEEHGLSGFSFE
jgi:hypothetical protein